MPMPRQHKKQVEEAEALHKRFYGGEEGGETKKPKPEDENLQLVEPAEDTSNDEETTEDTSNDEETTESTADAGSNDAVKKEKPTEKSSSDPYSGDYGKLLQAHRTLQGKYEAETGRMTDQIAAMQGRLIDLESLLANPPSSSNTDSEENDESNNTGQHLISEQEMEDYGADMIDVMRRAAREAVGQELQTLRAENAQLKQQLGGVQQTSAMSARQTMLSMLDSELSAWRQINKAPEFVQWAEDIDAFSGQRRIDMLRRAFDENNGPRVLAFFKAFVNENAAFKTNDQDETASQPQVDLNTLVAPGRASDGSDPRAQDQSNGRQWTQADIGKFYADVQRGVYRNDPAKKAKIEADIFAAQHDGRVVG